MLIFEPRITLNERIIHILLLSFLLVLITPELLFNRGYIEPY